jgi:hypothetical protein
MSTNSNAPTHTKNTPKSGYSGQGEARPPGAFNVVKLDLISSTGVRKDIRSLVESFTITSELFSPVVTFSATIRDNQKLFEPAAGEAFQICGQENIEIEIDPIHPVDLGSTPIKHTFSVKEYPTLTRTLDFPDVQIYTVLAISEFAYRSSLMNICRPLFEDQPLEKNIESIFKDDLGQREFNVRGKVDNYFDGIINIQRPLKAADWLRSRSFDGNSPFFLHSDTTKPGVIFMSSWKYLSDKSQNGSKVKYSFRPFSTKEPGTPGHTFEERTRILSMTSAIKLDRLKSANSGAYASRYNITDFASKSFYISDFISATPDPKSDWIPRKYKITKRDGTIAAEPMNSIPSSAVVSAHTNSTPTGSVYNSITTGIEKLPYTRALLARLNESTHEIVVYGRSLLQAGAIIELKVLKPKAGNDAAAKPQSEPQIDPLASGKYIILVVSSIFSEGIYTNKLKLAKMVPSLIGEIMEPTGGLAANKSGIEGITSTINPPPSADANNDGTISDSERDNYVKSLGNTTRGGTTGVKITSYGQANDSTGDSNTQAQRGFANNLLREGSVALSPDIYNQYKPPIGSAVYVNGQHVGYYEDRTPASYNGQNFGQTIDVYDPNNRLGSVLKNAGDAQLTFGPARPQISNP